MITKDIKKQNKTKQTRNVFFSFDTSGSWQEEREGRMSKEGGGGLKKEGGVGGRGMKEGGGRRSAGVGEGRMLTYG